MAGDWIPMRVDLADDPAVIAIAGATGLDEDAVVGKLHRLWSWANKHLENGYASSVTDSWIDRHTGTTGFAAAMLNAGWLRIRSGGVEFPSFDRWNSKGAKNRVLSAQRMKKKRDADSVTKSSPEKRREEKRREQEETHPAGGGGGKPAKFDPMTVELPHPSPAFAAAWVEWIQHRKEKRDPLTPTSTKKQIRQLASLTEPNAIACIERSIASSWLGLFPENHHGPATKAKPAGETPMERMQRLQAEMDARKGGDT
jgi:hypothetical protein